MNCVLLVCGPLAGSPRGPGAALLGARRLRDLLPPTPRSAHPPRTSGRAPAAPLFPGYAFIAVELQWHAARWSAGVINLIMDGAGPARVPDDVIAEIRGREIGGLIELAAPPALRRGARVRILRGPFSGHLAIFADMKPRERVEILLQLLGGEQRVTLAKKDIEVVR
jgi:transcription antitermination factor NusG